MTPSMLWTQELFKLMREMYWCSGFAVATIASGAANERDDSGRFRWGKCAEPKISGWKRFYTTSKTAILEMVNSS